MDPIGFSDHRLNYNALGKIYGGIGIVFLENNQGEASAISFNIASRLRVYRWDKSAKGRK